MKYNNSIKSELIECKDIFIYASFLKNKSKLKKNFLKILLFFCKNEIAQFYNFILINNDTKMEDFIKNDIIGCFFNKEIKKIGTNISFTFVFYKNFSCFEAALNEKEDTNFTNSIFISNKLDALPKIYEIGFRKIYLYKTDGKINKMSFDYKYLDNKLNEKTIYSSLNSKKQIKFLRFNTYSMSETVMEIQKLIYEKVQGLVVPVNLDMMRIAYKDLKFRRIINDSSISLVDGKPLIWMSKIYRSGIKHKVSGSDLIYPVLEMCNNERFSIFLVGGIDEAPKKAIDNIKKKYPNIVIKGFFSPEFGFEKKTDKDREVVEKINEANADLTLLCLSAPKQELFFERNKNFLNDTIFLCAGATVDFLAGTIKRAPSFLSKIGLEWFYRLLKEPKRLFKRYFLDFIFLLKSFFIK